MTGSDDALTGWVVSISGKSWHPEADQIVVLRRDSPHIRIEISAPGIQSAGEDQLRQGRQAIQAAVTALQEALDSPSALPGFRP